MVGKVVLSSLANADTFVGQCRYLREPMKVSALADEAIFVFWRCFLMILTVFTSQIICWFTVLLHIFCNVFLRRFTWTSTDFLMTSIGFTEKPTKSIHLIILIEFSSFFPHSQFFCCIFASK